jgi:hypothetical protein
MYRIPGQAEIRQRMLDAVRTSVQMLKGVAGFSVVRTERPGSAIGPHGGIQEDMQLDKVLIRMRASRPDSYGGKLIIVCTKLEHRLHEAGAGVADRAALWGSWCGALVR